MDINGKTAIVTGGFGNLGSAVVSSLRGLGAKVYILDIIESDDENAYSVDLTDESQIESILRMIDKIDLLVNCAGEIYSEPVLNILKGEKHSFDNWHRVISNNLDSCFVVSSRVADKMARSRTKGVIINFSSISAQGNMGQAAYSAAKAGIEALTKVMAKELGMFKIRVCAIAPGFIETDSTKKALSDAMLDYWKKETPLRRFGSTDDIIKTIKYIIETDYLSGAVIPVDGGLTI